MFQAVVSPTVPDYSPSWVKSVCPTFSHSSGPDRERYRNATLNNTTKVGANGEEPEMNDTAHQYSERERESKWWSVSD